MSTTEIWTIVKNSFWIVGLALLLATWSYARYAAHQAEVKTRDKLNELRYSLMMNLGTLLFVVGMVLTETRVWAQILWGVMGIVIFVQAYVQIKAAGTPPTEAETPPAESSDTP
jgi:hypothetical protein